MRLLRFLKHLLKSLVLIVGTLTIFMVASMHSQQPYKVAVASLTQTNSYPATQVINLGSFPPAPVPVGSGMINNSVKIIYTLEKKLLLCNKIGAGLKTVDFSDSDDNQMSSFVFELLPLVLNGESVSMLRERYDRTLKVKNFLRNSVVHTPVKKEKTQITVATIACGGRTEQLYTMLKSAVLFSQDSALHAVIFVDEEAFTGAASHLLDLKWTTDALGWTFTFEIHSEWFPEKNEESNTDWKSMFRKCATQRLFFPSLLPHIDSLIYVDADILIISNLTQLWLHIPQKMNTGKMAGLSQNNEAQAAGWYDGNQVPHYGPKGINAGVMLMNLTQMRKFNFQEKSIAAQELYKENIQLADQDIINIVFSAFPGKLLDLDCSFNFNWVHCGGDSLRCSNDGTKENLCFCLSAQRDGVKILHGNGGTFKSTYHHHLFLPQVYTAFKNMDLLTDSFTAIFSSLRTSFTNLTQPVCFPLSADVLYKNADKYFRGLNFKS